MIKRLKYILLSTIVLLALSSPTNAQLDSDAVQIVNNSMLFLAKKKHTSTKWFVTYDSGNNDENSVTTTWNGKSSLSRKKGYYAISERLGKRYEYFHDGQTFTAKNKDSQYYT